MLITDIELVEIWGEAYSIPVLLDMNVVWT